MKTTQLTQFLGLSLTLITLNAKADDLSLSLRRYDGTLVSYRTANSSASSLSYSISGSRGFGSDSVSYGGVDLDLTSNSPAYNLYGGQLSASATINNSLTILTDPALNGTGGTIVQSIRLSGAFAMTGVGYAHFGVNGNNGGYFYPNTLDPQSPNATLTTTQGITFNSSGALVSLQTNVGGSAQANPPDPGFPGTHAHVNLSVRTGAIAVRDSLGNTVNFTSTSQTGTTRASNVSIGSSYSGFTLANTAGHSSTLSLLDGTAGSAGLASLSGAKLQASPDRYVQAAFLASPNAGGGLTPVSDGVDFTGTGTDRFVLQLSFDETAVLAAGLTDADLHMEWLDPSDGTFKDAYLGDSDGGAAHQQLAGPYLGGAEFQLGNYGVDPVGHTLWAVLDHNSEFVVGTVVPEPASAALLGLGMLLPAARRRHAQA